MSSTVRINYDRFVNTGIVPSTDFENSVMEEILEWADDTFDEDAKISLADLIELYWACKLEGLQVMAIDDEELDTEVDDINADGEPITDETDVPSAQILNFPEK